MKGLTFLDAFCILVMFLILLYVNIEGINSLKTQLTEIQKTCTAEGK